VKQWFFTMVQYCVSSANCVYIMGFIDYLCIILPLNFEHSCGHLQLSVHNIRLPKQSTVGDVINELKGKVRLVLPLTCQYILFYVDSACNSCISMDFWILVMLL
jgi:hypothetical protein